MTDKTDTDRYGIEASERFISRLFDDAKKNPEELDAAFQAISGLVASTTTFKILRFSEERGEKRTAEVIWEYICARLEEEEYPEDNPIDQETY